MMSWVGSVPQALLHSRSPAQRYPRASHGHSMTDTPKRDRVASTGASILPIRARVVVQLIEYARRYTRSRWIRSTGVERGTHKHVDESFPRVADDLMQLLMPLPEAAATSVASAPRGTARPMAVRKGAVPGGAGEILRMTP